MINEQFDDFETQLQCEEVFTEELQAMTQPPEMEDYDQSGGTEWFESTD